MTSTKFKKKKTFKSPHLEIINNIVNLVSNLHPATCSDTGHVYNFTYRSTLHTPQGDQGQGSMWTDVDSILGNGHTELHCMIAPIFHHHYTVMNSEHMSLHRSPIFLLVINDKKCLNQSGSLSWHALLKRLPERKNLDMRIIPGTTPLPKLDFVSYFSVVHCIS